MVRSLLLLVVLFVITGCDIPLPIPADEGIMPGPTEANLERISVGTTVEDVNLILKNNIPAEALSAQVQINLDEPLRTKSGSTVTQIPVKIDFAEGKVTKVERAKVD